MDYNIALAQIYLNEDGSGEGVVAAGVRLGFNRETNTLILEDYDTQPVRLRNVRMR